MIVTLELHLCMISGHDNYFLSQSFSTRLVDNNISCWYSFTAAEVRSSYNGMLLGVHCFVKVLYNF